MNNSIVLISRHVLNPFFDVWFLKVSTKNTYHSTPLTLVDAYLIMICVYIRQSVWCQLFLVVSILTPSSVLLLLMCTFTYISSILFPPCFLAIFPKFSCCLRKDQEIHGPTDRQTDRQIDRQIDRQTDRRLRKYLSVIPGFKLSFGISPVTPAGAAAAASAAASTFEQLNLRVFFVLYYIDYRITFERARGRPAGLQLSNWLASCRSNRTM